MFKVLKFCLLFCFTLSYLEASGYEGKSIQNEPSKRNVNDYQEVLSFKAHGGAISCVSFSPDGKRIISGSADNTIKIWDAISGYEIDTLKGHTDKVTSVVYNSEGTKIASASWDKTLKIWDTNTGKEIRTLKGHKDLVFSVQFSSDGKKIISGGNDYSLRIWEVASGKVIYTLEGHTNEVDSVSVSPDGNKVVSASWDKTLKIWDTNTGKEIRTLKGHTGEVPCAAFSPDGKKIVSGSFDNDIKIWDVFTGKEMCTLKGHLNFVNSVSFSADGTKIISGSVDNTLKIWDAVSCQEIATLKGHKGSVLSVVFSKDGKMIASGGEDQTIKIWSNLDNKYGSASNSKTKTMPEETNPSMQNKFEKEVLYSADAESFRDVVKKAGYNNFTVTNNGQKIPQIIFQMFTRFGDLSEALKYENGDKFDKIEMEQKSSKHQANLEKRKFFLDRIEFIPNLNLLETKGVILEVFLPFRVAYWDNLSDSKEKNCVSGILKTKPSPCDIGQKTYYLTKDKTLSYLDPSLYKQAKELNAILYDQEVGQSRLLLFLDADKEKLRNITKNPGNFSITIEFSSLHYGKPNTWGYYKREILQEFDFDSEEMRSWWPPLVENKNKAPDYFVTATSENPEKLPNIVMAKLLSLSINDLSSGKVIGGYKTGKKISP